MKAKYLIIPALFFASVNAIGQWSGTNPELLSGTAKLSGDLFVGPSGAGLAIPGAPPVTATPDRKINLYRSHTGGMLYPLGTPLSSYTTGLKIVHKVSSYGATPAQWYNWEMASDHQHMYFHFANANRTIMALRQDGKVSIGLSTGAATYVGDYSLYVGNGILTEKIKVALASAGDWSDYVFADNYNLMPLSDVETFVKENKHLPGVPSAEEVVETGIDLAKMDAKLLEKIEELTLYVIDLKKENDAIRKELEALKSTSVTQQ